METHWIAITTVEDAFRQVEPALAWLDEALNNISVGIANMSMGRLPVTLFPTLQVEAMLKEIKAVLPPGWSLSPCIQNGHTWKLYMEAKVVVATVIISLPHPIGNATLGAQFEPFPPFFAGASDSQAFVELTVSDSSRCVTSTTSICPICRAVYRKHRELSCAMALFLKDEERHQASAPQQHSTLCDSVGKSGSTSAQLLPEPAEEETSSSLKKKVATASKPLLSRHVKFQGRISLMGVHLRVIKEEEKARVAMEVDGTVGLRYPYELIIAIVGSLLGFAASLVFSWHNVTGGVNVAVSVFLCES
ncbi:hypothetical protein OUZ56_021520 [Daphnia magna]|uniref:Uncharacterized protein n=1 Tax=Daphnia magna TaxID=35525 RepID=A0ABQ9ZHL7_9CRUS|nr:hypothetical protein OUZ56_021520 [Daphnia magna]